MFQQIVVGDPSVKWESLPPQSDEKRVLITRDGKTFPSGITTETIERIEIDGRAAFKRMQAVQSDEIGHFSHTTVVWCDTFAPVSHQNNIGGIQTAVEYDGLTVHGTQADDGGSLTPIFHTLSQPVFDLFAIEMVMRLLPLAEHYEARLDTFHASIGVELSVHLRVSGQDHFEAHGAAWAVEATFGDFITNLYWITPATHQLIKQYTASPDGMIMEFVRP